jgi:hypothetical protein
MLEALKPLMESGLINEDIGQQLNEAWEEKLNEAKEQIRAELRDEYAGKYVHDRSVMVEALDKMVTDSLSHEIKEFNEERRGMNEDRVRAKQQLTESANKFNNFMVQKLAEELKELRQDRKVQMENQQKLEKFVVHALAKEIKEFTQDKQAVVEAKVKLVAEGRNQLNKLKAKFVAESAKKINRIVTNHIKGEMTQLKEDIKLAKENNFGRKIYEAFAGEFSVTYLNDKAETRNLMNKLVEKDKQLSESIDKLQKTQKLVESKEREVRIIKESAQRTKVIEELTSSLNEEKAQVMISLLESVQTPKLKAAFDKYLPAVLNTGSHTKTEKSVINESLVEVTGNKSARKIAEIDRSEKDNVIDIKRLAGL